MSVLSRDNKLRIKTSEEKWCFDTWDEQNLSKNQDYNTWEVLGMSKIYPMLIDNSFPVPRRLVGPWCGMEKLVYTLGGSFPGSMG